MALAAGLMVVKAAANVPVAIAGLLVQLTRQPAVALGPFGPRREVKTSSPLAKTGGFGEGL